MTEPRALTAITIAELAQTAGSDPSRSSWVAASAGSGKTKVLRDRVLRLMLTGVDPARILCLTFTKAAAAEMSNRLAATLASWAALSHDKLRLDVSKLTGGELSEEMLITARRLFARVLDTPGGMKIMTIHAFCQSLLRRFPLEAGVAPHFELLEDRDQAELLRQARDEMLMAARSGDDQALSEALLLASARMSEGRLDDLFKEMMSKRSRLKLLLRRSGGLAAIERSLCDKVGLAADEGRAEILMRAVSDDVVPAGALRRAVQALNQGSNGDIERARVIANWLNADAAQRTESFSDYMRAFLNKTGTPTERLATRKALQALPELDDILAAEQQRISAVCERLKAVEIALGSRALLRLSVNLLERYEGRKASLARLDYEDLIQLTCELLQKPGIAPWVLYKLDGGIDHVLIDEAQDTNPDQWQVIASLTGEFFAGLGAVDRPRTIFAVGDVKQSIFSFQGAEPAEFTRYRDHFQKLDADRFQVVQLNVSFRSTEAVLRTVDRVFQGEAGQGVAIEAEIKHHVSREDQYGEVTLWPLACPMDADGQEPWSPPVITDAAAAPEARMAEAIATEIARLLKYSTTRQGNELRRLEPGDFMILVRSRNAFVELMVRALKQRNIPVAGVDRMILLDQIAVMDLMAFAQFLLLPEDDLNLASLLRSPLLGLSEDQLFELCHGRGHRTLWSRLLENDKEWARASRDLLQHFQGRAGQCTPFELYTELLGAARGRHKLYRRLGPECGEAVDEFLNLAIDYESRHAPSLQGFLAWLGSGEMEVKRDLDEGAGQVRIMTVHASKGLQAPVVFIADQRRRPKPSLGLFWLKMNSAGAGDELMLPIWSPNKDADIAATAALRDTAADKVREEENRLLYVAMTRAEDRLYVCGWRGRQSISDPSWRDHVAQALEDMSAAGADVVPCDSLSGGPDWSGPGWEGASLRLRMGMEDATSLPDETLVDEQAAPEWLHRPAPVERQPSKPLSPTRPAGDEPAALSPLGSDQGWRFRRGLLIHHLLELLPQIADPMRERVALNYLARPVHGLTAEAAREIASEILAILHNPEFAPIFGPSSRAEVPIVAELHESNGDVRLISGQIDRLVVLPDSVWIVDFKSNRPAPMQISHVSLQYQQQLAAYRKAVRELYPDRQIRCFLLWSDGPRLMEIPTAMLDAHG